MSGGHFDYLQYRIHDIAEQIKELIASNEDKTPCKWGEFVGRHYSPETIQRFKETEHTLRQAAEMAQRVDYLVSGDDGEESFHSRWGEEVPDYWINLSHSTESSDNTHE